MTDIPSLGLLMVLYQHCSHYREVYSLSYIDSTPVIVWYTRGVMLVVFTLLSSIYMSYIDCIRIIAVYRYGVISTVFALASGIHTELYKRYSHYVCVYSLSDIGSICIIFGYTHRTSVIGGYTHGII